MFIRYCFFFIKMFFFINSHLCIVLFFKLTVTLLTNKGAFVYNKLFTFESNKVKTLYSFMVILFSPQLVKGSHESEKKKEIGDPNRFANRLQ